MAWNMSALARGTRGGERRRSSDETQPTQLSSAMDRSRAFDVPSPSTFVAHVNN